jgi:hypothetical protein
MRTSHRCLAALVALAWTASPVVAQAQTVPVDQPFVVAPLTSVPANKTTLAVNLTPSTLGCSGSQVFYVRSITVGGTLPPSEASVGGYYVTAEVTQAHSGGPATTTPVTFPAAGGATGNMSGSGVMFAQTFMLSSVGAPVSSVSVYKSGWAANMSIIVWGYCGNPTTLGALTPIVK